MNEIKNTPNSCISYINRVGNLIEECDIIGKVPILKLGNKVRNKTTFGGLLCLLIYILMFTGFLYFGQEIYFKIMPNTVKSTHLMSDTDEIKVGGNDFMFMLAVKDKKGDFIKLEEEYFNIQIKFVNSTFNEKIEIENCKNEKLNDINNFLCLKQNTIENKISLNNLSKLKIQINKSTNSSTKSIDEINEKLKEAQLIIKYIDYVFDLRKFNDFATQYIHEEKIILNPILKKDINFEIMQIEFFTDGGYIIEDFINNIFYKKSKVSENFEIKINNNYDDEILCNLNLISSNQKKIYYRKYYKIQNLIAEMGGLGKSFFLIAFILNFFNDHSKYYEKLIDDLFDQDDLFKYYQYYNPRDKQIFKKYRDSILLRNTKNADDLKKDLEGLNHSTIQFKLNNFMSQNILKKKEEKKYFNEFDEEDISNGKKNKINLEVKLEDLNKIKDNSENLSIESQSNKTDQNIYENFLEGLKKNLMLKDNFYRIKKKKFRLNCIELVKYSLCPKNMATFPKGHILAGGKEMINSRMDIIHILKKNLEFDRFKNLLLRDYQILLLNSLSKFMLDPERVNLVDYENCTYEKMIDAYGASISNNTIMDRNLGNWIKSKFHFE